MTPLRAHPPGFPARRKSAAPLAALLVALLAVILSGCGQGREVSNIAPTPSSRSVNNPDLGPAAVDPLSFGPGDKDSPSWSPAGDQVAFVVDGYVSVKTLSSGNSTRRTTRDLGAERVTWPASGEELAILGKGVPSGSAGGGYDTYPLYVTHSGEGQLKIESLAENVLAMSSSSGGGPLVAALASGPYKSRISTVDTRTGTLESYPETIKGRVTEISVSPNGSHALAAVVTKDGSGSGRYEIRTIDLKTGKSERLTQLDKGLEMFGSPQQTSDGIYYVAGKRASGQSQNSEIRYSLYRLPKGSSSPERASEVGEDFIASSIKSSPDGRRLALLGRRDSGSATNLYVLDLANGALYSATSNQNMEIKTGVDSLDWRPDGQNVAIVARSDISGARVYKGPASRLLAPFYNLYNVPVNNLQEKS